MAGRVVNYSTLNFLVSASNSDSTRRVASRRQLAIPISILSLNKALYGEFSR